MSNTADDKIKRSRGGCRECRRRHRRCDEARPACGLCVSVGKECVYSTQLRWGGRPFAKSRFGACLGAKAVITVDSSNSLGQRAFHYSTRDVKPREAKSLESDGVASAASSSSVGSVLDSGSDAELERSTADQGQIPDICSATSAGPLVLPGALGIFSPQSAALQNHLDYFIHVVSGVLSCHEAVQESYLTTYLPLAMGCEHLLHAMAMLGAAHRYSIAEKPDSVDFTLLRWRSVKLLRDSLAQNVPSDIEQVLATSLALCLADVVVSNGDGDSWKIHLRGASALIKQLDARRVGERSEKAVFLTRVYKSLTAIAMACGSVDFASAAMASTQGGETGYIIDDMYGFSAALVPVFEQLNFLGRDLVPAHLDPLDILNTDTTEVAGARAAFDRVYGLLLLRDKMPRDDLAVYPAALQPELDLLDESFHHMALILLVTRGRLSIPGYDVQQSVQAIIRCVSRMKQPQRPTPTPFAATLAPLFAAGSVASSKHDRNRIFALMGCLWNAFGMGNVRSTRQHLDSFWRRRCGDDGAPTSPGQLLRLEFSLPSEILPY